MTKEQVEALCAQWLSERLDPNDQEGLAAFREWMEGFGSGGGRDVTIRDVLAAWEVIRERRRLH